MTITPEIKLKNAIPEAWQRLLKDETASPRFAALAEFVDREYREQQVFPPQPELFTAFRLTPPEKVKVLILGQDPYHGPGQAHGLAFSVPDGVPQPPSLRNICKELADDLNIAPPLSGNLSSWAEQGVLLLNAVLTVRAHAAASHKKQGWEEFTDGVIKAVDALPQPLVFVLWGNPAAEKQKLISRHRCIVSAHPSPLSAYRGFFGSRPFSRINAILEEAGCAAIDWQSIVRSGEPEVDLLAWNIQEKL
ncbi:MAG: uracil-DNA glycosylase [Lentisphaeria bacterium]|nr:uracil-DNA glycosylase [Lentisphaeria bacterium]